MLLRVDRRVAAAHRAGFTLMELLVVVAILLVLAGVATPAYFAYLESSKVKLARSEAVRLAGELSNFAIANTEQFPESQGYPVGMGFMPLVNAGILKREPMDPWGRPYTWTLVPQGASQGPLVMSSGPNGIPGDADDISSD